MLSECRIADQLDHRTLLRQVHLDVQSTAMDASYFPFEEHLDSMLLVRILV